MNIKINSDFQFSVVSIQYTATGELSICLSSDDFSSGAHYQYSANLGNSQAEERPSVSLLQYAKAYAASANIKPKTRESYMHVCRHLKLSSPLAAPSGRYILSIFKILMGIPQSLYRGRLLICI